MKRVPMALIEKTYICNCCGGAYNIDLDKNDPTPFQCSWCVPHRDNDLTFDGLRAILESHKLLYQQNSAELGEELSAAKSRVSSTYHVRGLALEVLNDINAIHNLRANGLCSCNVKSCRVGALIDGNKIISNLVRAYDKRVQRQLREEASLDRYDEWDRFIDIDSATRPRPPIARHEVG